MSRAILTVLLLSFATVVAVSAPPDARLVQAVKNGDKSTAASLLQQKVDVNIPEIDGTTALHYAVRADDLNLVDKLIAAGAKVKVSNRYGVTPLYLASLNGSAPMLEKLLKAGADANEVGNEGETALMTAARTGNADAAKVLLAHGAAVDSKEGWLGQTALMWAAAEKHPDMVKELIAHGAAANANSSVVKWERQQSAEPREKWMPLGGLTPMMFAAREGCAACVPILASAGGDVNAADPDGYTPLILALMNGQYDAAGALLEKNADPNLAHKTGVTPLYAAVDAHTMPESNRPSPKEIDNDLTSFDVIKALVAHGANVNAQLKQQQPYRTKLDRGDDTMLGAGTTPLVRAAKAADTDVVKFLLEKGADPKLAGRGGVTPLMAAAGVGTKDEDTTGRHKTAAEMIDTIKLLMAAGLDINAAESTGRTALHGAALQGFDPVVQFLVDNGAKLDAKDRNGRTPLDMAMGLAGGAGFDGTAGVAHESTATLIRKLMAAPTSK
ncbi:MAG TPA: ankyrin repeat domain-containing protein [Terriglobia bacterium]|nr:ankyrin repeat domain-containing protein [Terriglobia bacterium]